MVLAGPDVVVFHCTFRDTPFENEVKTCAKEFAMATDARQHRNRVHQGQAVNVYFRVKIKATQFLDCGKFLQSCRTGMRKHKFEAPTASATENCTFGAAVPDFQAEAGHLGPAVKRYSAQQLSKSWEPFGQAAQVLLGQLNVAKLCSMRTGRFSHETSGD